MIFGKLWDAMEYKERDSAVTNRETPWLEILEERLPWFLVAIDAV